MATFARTQTLDTDSDPEPSKGEALLREGKAGSGKRILVLITATVLGALVIFGLFTGPKTPSRAVGKPQFEKLFLDANTPARLLQRASLDRMAKEFGLLPETLIKMQSEVPLPLNRLRTRLAAQQYLSLSKDELEALELDPLNIDGVTGFSTRAQLEKLVADRKMDIIRGMAENSMKSITAIETELAELGEFHELADKWGVSVAIVMDMHRDGLLSLARIKMRLAALQSVHLPRAQLDALLMKPVRTGSLPGWAGLSHEESLLKFARLPQEAKSRYWNADQEKRKVEAKMEILSAMASRENLSMAKMEKRLAALWEVHLPQKMKELEEVRKNQNLSEEDFKRKVYEAKRDWMLQKAKDESMTPEQMEDLLLVPLHEEVMDRLILSRDTRFEKKVYEAKLKTVGGV